MTQARTAFGLIVVGGLVALGTLAIPIAGAEDAKWYPFPVEVWDPPFNMDSPRKEIEYQPVAKAEKEWDICVSFPHMKDSYWIAVDYGVVAESERLHQRVRAFARGEGAAPTNLVGSGAAHQSRYPFA